MGSILKKLVLGAALVAGTLGAGATQANAERVRVVVGSPIAYRPACPGPGYAWVAGYYNGGGWVPGFWRFAGPRVGVVVGPGFVHGRYFDDRDRGFRRDRDDFYRDRDRRFAPERYRR